MSQALVCAACIASPWHARVVLFLGLHRKVLHSLTATDTFPSFFLNVEHVWNKLASHTMFHLVSDTNMKQGGDRQVSVWCPVAGNWCSLYLVHRGVFFFFNAYALFFKHLIIYHLKLLNSCIAPPFFFFCLLVAGVMQGGEEFSLPVVHSCFFYGALQKPYDGLDVVGSLPFTCCACRPHFIYLREKGELSALPSMLPSSSPESASATSIPKRGSSRGDPSAAAVFPSLPSLWPLLRTRLTITDHKVPTAPWKMPNTWQNSIVGPRPTLLRVTNAHSESRRGSRTSFEIPPPYFFRAFEMAFMQLLIFSCLSI